MKPPATIILRCEDRLHSCFVRYFLESLGFRTPDFDAKFSPTDNGSAEQWVREQLPDQLRALRSRGGRTLLIIVTDADKYTVTERKQGLLGSLDARNVARPSENEGVFYVIPKWAIETWLGYLEHGTFDEDKKIVHKPYKDRESECRPHVQKLVQMCRDKKLVPDPPASLQTACNELVRLKAYLDRGM